ncbi:uncharacterized protein LOC128206600 isoform X2 [Mya arenaria]|uniref:uncharacterized protein LOC128206600 isoform X2 n=2 Tax=Mya arenaria TaxID=6604 RepID=UPI0022E5F409|nr:uncharacterized protein LOC128206600 isoform X2 [Mya arenaria]
MSFVKDQKAKKMASKNTGNGSPRISDEERNRPIDVVIPQKGAVDKVKEGLHQVKVCRYDADQLERELEGELFDKWHEKCEVVKATKIAMDRLPAYLDHMQDAYEGIDDQVRKKMNGILFTTDSWEYQIVEWKFNKGADSGARYGMMAFGLSPDGKFVDCMYVMYMMDFKVAPKRIVTEKKHTALWGIINWTTESVSYEERNLGAVSIKKLQNFFRLKAMQGFLQNGVIDRINYVTDLDAIAN